MPARRKKIEPGRTAELEALSRALIAELDDERQSFASELHGGIAQQLALVKLLLDRALKSPADRARSHVKEAQALVSAIFSEVVDLSFRLHPSMLSDLGLPAALKWYLEQYTTRTGVRVALRQSGMSVRLPRETAEAAYYIVLDALSIVEQHSTADKHVVVRLRASKEALKIHIEHGGGGFERSMMKSSSVITTMRERALTLGGKMKIQPAPGGGVAIIIELPLPPPEREAGGQPPASLSAAPNSED